MTGAQDVIRVGVLIESSMLPAWQIAILESIAHSEIASLALTILRVRRKDSNSARSVVRIVEGFTYKLFERIEDKSRRPTPDACRLASAESILRVVPSIMVRGPLSSTVDFVQLDPIKGFELDVILDLSDGSEETHFSPLARWGCWYYESERAKFLPASGSRVGFRDVLIRSDCLQTSLMIESCDSSERRAAYQTASSVDCLSHYVTRNEHLWKCSSFVFRALRKCSALGGDEYLRSLSLINRAPARNRARLQVFLQGLRPLLELASYSIWRARRKLYRHRYDERWTLMYAVDADAFANGQFRELEPPPDRFWADPHLADTGGALHVYFEDASLKTGIGRISLLSRRADGEFGQVTPILEKPYHLSYPFIFEWQGNWYLIPESASNRTVELYRCTRFPDKWEFQYNLMEGVRAYDSTLLEHGGRWWLFANVCERDGASTWDELCIFHADSPISRDWRPHPENPVISDVRQARPAGRFLLEAERLVRPSQDSSTRYGYAINLCEVLELNERCYREAPIAKFRPDLRQSIVGMHTYSRLHGTIFIDAVRRSRRHSHHQPR